MVDILNNNVYIDDKVVVLVPYTHKLEIGKVVNTTEKTAFIEVTNLKEPIKRSSKYIVKV